MKIKLDFQYRYTKWLTRRWVRYPLKRMVIRWDFVYTKITFRFKKATPNFYKLIRKRFDFTNTVNRKNTLTKFYHI